VIDEAELKERIVMATAELRLARAKRCQNGYCRECPERVIRAKAFVTEAIDNLTAFRNGLL